MKKLSLFAASAIVLATAIAAIPALADTTSSTGTPAPSTVSATHMMVTVDQVGRARVVGTLSAVSGTTLSVASWGGTWSIDTSSAKLYRRYGGASNISEFQTGDVLAIWGIASASGLSITATKVQDQSIQARNVHPRGPISNLDSTKNNFTLTAGNQTYHVTLDPNARIIVNGKTAAFADLVSGVVAQVRGVLDRNNLDIAASRVDQRTSIQLIGTISSPNSASSSFTLTTANHGAVSVTLGSSAVVRVNGGTAAFADLVDGMYTRVIGTWSTVNTAVTASNVSAYTRVPHVKGTEGLREPSSNAQSPSRSPQNTQ